MGLLLFPQALRAQGLRMVEETAGNPSNEPTAVFPVPDERQVLWQETEFYAFFHYGMNTYTGLEWGMGNEAEAQFAPTAAPNPRQWLEVAKSAGMRGGIAVVKHHDGFCLWPTATTAHSVARAGNKYGRKTNIPRDFAKAARKLRMKYGFYVSPWDRNSGEYGKPTYVNDVFLKQCAELAKYGSDQFEMWFDGANGGDGYYGGAGGTRSIDRETYYDIPNLRDSVHKVAPNCVMWGLGGEARWIGNEQGWAGETNWSTQDRDAGEGNNMYGDIHGYYWNPGESDAKATTKGWFWHEGEEVLSAERLFQMYLETVGRNATLILNLPPDRSGSLPAATVSRMKELGEMLNERLKNDLALSASVTASEERTAGKGPFYVETNWLNKRWKKSGRNYVATNLTDNDKTTYWATNDGTKSAVITLEWKVPQALRYVSLMEYIRKGQRVKHFTIETSMDGNRWEKQGGNIPTTTIGYKRIIPLNGSTADSYSRPVQARYLRITIDDSKACPLLHTLSVY